VSDDPLAVLARIRSSERPPLPSPGERCELCREPIADEHGHVVDVVGRGLLCACRGCYLLFTSEGSGGGHFKAVPDRFEALPELRMSLGQWDRLQIPVEVAFFFVNSALARVCGFYPSPAGATESLLPLDAWDDLVSSNPELATLEPDVEALLVRADSRGGAPRCFIVPIDACYELVGDLRRLWKGFDGGQEARVALDDFFDRVTQKAVTT
jgi:hypothetical protein